MQARGVLFHEGMNSRALFARPLKRTILVLESSPGCKSLSERSFCEVRGRRAGREINFALPLGEGTWGSNRKRPLGTVPAGWPCVQLVAQPKQKSTS